MSAPRRLPLALLALLVLLLAACGREAPPRAAQPAGTPSATGAAQPTADPGGDAPIDTRRALGDPNAPITIIEYSDFQ